MNGPMTVVNTIDSSTNLASRYSAITGRVGRRRRASWTDANDNVGVIEYRVETDTDCWNTNMASVTANLLMPETQYNFSMLAVDGAVMSPMMPNPLRSNAAAAH